MKPWTPTEERALETYLSKGLGFAEQFFKALKNAAMAARLHFILPAFMKADRARVVRDLRLDKFNFIFYEHHSLTGRNYSAIHYLTLGHLRKLLARAATNSTGLLRWVKAKAVHMRKCEVRNCTPDLVSQQWDKEVASARSDNG